MDEKTVIITERDGKYSIQNNGVSDFALIGILECILFEMKSAPRRAAPAPVSDEKIPPPLEELETEAGMEEPADISPVDAGEAVEAAAEISSDQKETVQALQVRIGKAVQAIRDLGGEIVDVDIEKMSEAQLQTEFEELTTQYKRLKNSQVNKKR